MLSLTLHTRAFAPASLSAAPTQQRSYSQCKCELDPYPISAVVIPPFLSARKLVIRGRTLSRSPSLLAGCTSWELAIALVPTSGVALGVGSKGNRQPIHLYFSSPAYLRVSSVGFGAGCNKLPHLHLEQADTGLETRSRGLSEKLDRGIMSDNRPGYHICRSG